MCSMHAARIIGQVVDRLEDDDPQTVEWYWSEVVLMLLHGGRKVGDT